MRATWGSKIGFILAAAGSAIGLGNIWRFPYLAAENGGIAFILIYLICVGLLGYFILTAKLAFGRLAKTNFMDGFKKVATSKVSLWWGRIGGGLALFNIFAVSAVYIIVIGWTLSYVFAAGKNLVGFNAIKIDKGLFDTLAASFGSQLFWILACLLISGLILIKGIKGGIEKVSLYLMPILFLLLVFMVGRMIFLPGAGKGFAYLFVPHWEQLGFSAEGFDWHQFAHLVLLVLGQAVYSLSLGLGVCFVYGSYLKADNDIKASAMWVVILDSCVAFLASMIVLPAVFAFDLETAQGPALSFITLPVVFDKMAGGTFFMLIFFVLLFVGALTSLIAIFEPAINLIMEKLHFTRAKATLTTLGINLFCALFVLASATKKIDFGKDLFDLFDYVTGTYTLSAMILLYCIFMGWKICPQLLQSLHNNNRLFKIYFPFVLKWFAPIVLILLFLCG